METERVLQAKIKKTLQRACNALVYKTECRGQAGFPDLTIVVDGRVTFLEVKTLTGRVSRLQEHCIKQMKAHGARVFVVRSVEEALSAVNGE